MKNKTIGMVVAYNIKLDVLKKNIDSYIGYVDKMLIIDNSENMDLKKIEKDNIVYISLGGNKGIGKALNVGAEYAIKSGYDFMLTMDQDSCFENNLVEEFKKNICEDVAIYAPNYLIDRKKNKKIKKDSQVVYWTMTSGNLLNLDAYRKIGGFREDFFIDAVDYEYCLRAKKHGFKVLQCNTARLHHNPGITKIKHFLIFDYKYGYMNPIRFYYQIRNLLYVSDEYSSIRAKIIIYLKILKVILLFENKIVFLKYFKKARYDFKHKITGKLKE